ncbi:tetratricopeptide repeat protein [Zavarzinella formosa]|uniref:tetratricopeptide repeat protein n=1 Tax=Zavarzinella formosa TaxID=360055 RepID=UPI0002E62D4D|nr:tetratricopeptide repeat protein [Zavarzinella formosa]
MFVARLVSHYRELPQLLPPDDPDLWAARMHDRLRVFRRNVEREYTEGTLQRLLNHPSAEARRASVLALGLIGTMNSNCGLARALRDEDAQVSKMATDALWQLWFRGGTDEQNQELCRVIHLPDFLEVLAGLDDLLREAPTFAEVHNQRAILFFRRGEYGRSAADCERVLQLNPYHFGAMAGLGQCYLKLRKPRSAVRCFRQAVETNPSLGHLNETIAAVEKSLDG